MSDETVGLVILGIAAFAMLAIVAPVVWRGADDRREERRTRTRDPQEGKPGVWQGDAGCDAS